MSVTTREQRFAIVFADIVGSTRLFDSMGDEKAKETIIKIQKLLADVVQDSPGEVINYIGDEIMCRFPDANTAIDTAINMQRAIGSMPPIAGTPVAVRIGINWGSVIADGDRLFGDTINIASRMTEIAEAGQIITSKNVVEKLPPEAQNLAGKFDKVKVKGKKEPISIYDILWEREDVTTIVTASKAAPIQVKEDALILEYHKNQFAVTNDGPAFKIGRSEDTDLVVDSTFASRNHARSDFRRGKFVLTDQSTNGTYVKTNDGKVVYLRREELPLWGSGIIAVGEAISPDNENTIAFYCP